MTTARQRSLLPSDTPLTLLGTDGEPTTAEELPADEVLLELHRRMVVGRRFDTQATALTKQGRLAVYPSSRGQEACQVGAVLALEEQDWLFPTYRDSVALVSRGVDPVETLTLLQGGWHLGYDPYEHRVGPQCTPLATNTLHAVGMARAAQLKGEDSVALVLLGDGATSEGDTHEALNFAGVWQAPVVFLVQNNGYAISVPMSKQNAAPSLAHKGIGYGVASELIDGNDPAAVHTTVREAVAAARAGAGPTLIEALTYRVEAHTNADDANRYRDADEVAAWLGKDPVDRLERHLTSRGLLDDARRAAVAEEAEAFAASVRNRVNVDVEPDPAELFTHVYAEPTAALREQAGLLAEEIAGAKS
ncbi:pyruvate dehydrogenase (acetyl-transferring) E1 component subunit alpha [Saccharopolyspora erythraea]|uniref:pyruvate dehydrogenase (acetyl-transferring) E1 component subunit alpha n=1 Tax=Saccharopolyspora erythraea TaxID=1836 RepID=UPI001BA9B613|nr:pyruvate dehydrogenase (acetyl-transferring) E1 component subunit alpha [Saccharopolyspora erythraea]QUH02639.1 pyruvate dehydrogenase (acetyl-transferring) E1 component subunit alpha [Saccharopolyspora erythraea]